MRVLPLLLVLGCNQDVGLTTLVPRMAVAPDALDFGDVAVPSRAIQTVFITNNGGAALSLTVDFEGEAVFEADVVEASVPPDTTLELGVGFVPPSFLSYSGELVLLSNDELTPEARVLLAGTGVDLPMPDIELSPQTLDFGVVASGTTSTLFLTVRNTGDAPLSLGSLAQSGSGAFELVTDPSNNSIGPSSEVPVLIRYTPTSEQGDSGVLTFSSDDPDEPSLDVVLLGNGGGDFEYPVAVVDCPGVSEPPIWVDFDGAGSTDPTGHLPLTFEWTLLSSPVGSQEEIVNPTSTVSRLFTDVAGSYEVQLVVTNGIGTQSAPARCVVNAIPVDELHVELLWDGASADLDLHLARDGAALFAPPNDCSFCNAGPNWGGLGAADDPRLDLDDQGGYGPENINLRTPAEEAYQVRVHYFEEHADAAVNATVRVFSYGTLAWEGQRLMSENDVWDVGLVNWPDGTFGVQSVDLYPAPSRSCLP